MTLNRTLACAAALAAVVFCIQPGVSQQPPPTLDELPRAIHEAGDTPYLPEPDKLEQRILAGLKGECQVEFVDTPLTDAVAFLREMAGIPIILDVAALDDEGVPTDEPMNLSLSGISLRSVLKILLDDYGLTWAIEDEVLKITSKVEAAKVQLTRVYPVGDLVDPPELDTWAELIDTLQAGTDAEWEDVDGTGGSVTSVRIAKALVIRQSRSSHETIVELLHSLREARRLAAVLDVHGEVSALRATLAVPEIEIDIPLLPARDADETTLVIDVTPGKRGGPAVLHVDGRTETLPKLIEQLRKTKDIQNRSVLLRASPDVKHEDVVLLLDALRSINIQKLSIAVAAEPEERAEPKNPNVPRETVEPAAR